MHFAATNIKLDHFNYRILATIMTEEVAEPITLDADALIEDTVAVQGVF